MKQATTMNIEIWGVAGFPTEIRPGDDLAGLVSQLCSQDPHGLLSGDVVVVTHKVVSKAEGRVAKVDPDDQSSYLQLIETEASSILRRKEELTITKTKHGFICANAGVDRSNTLAGEVVLLPFRPDHSAQNIRHRIRRDHQIEVAVVITDTFGRAWRHGLVDVAIGVAGIEPILDLRGQRDHSDRELEAAEIAVVDEIAAAADLVMGKMSGIPVAVLRGYEFVSGEGSIESLIRPAATDMFR